MYLLYADESGSSSDPKQIHFVLAGICVYERQSFWLASELDKIASRFNPSDPLSVELHGNPMFGGKNYWRRIPRDERVQAIKDSLSLIASHNLNRVFGCVVRKSVVSPKDPVEFAFEQLASRFDYFLRRLHNSGDTQRGIIIFDKSTYESTIQNLATYFRTTGHSWDILRNLAEVPLFIDSKASRLIQLADLVAYAILRKYEQGDDQFFNIIENRFDGKGGIRHGLYETV
ncbi:DUF3800 domain-containing protein [Foetidibacter luteolus]|uniref:DUF3800 domain-containing protein n=1 Tax=Foetidibacter luteolus TaxID=2608880 RepID=UPI00129B1E11|nr:DUF3800 domain-containing protein [Foetidibacter luteolus]